MNNSEAWKIIGNQPKWAIRNMITALEMCSLMNTDEEAERLKAARIVRRNGYKNPRYSS